MVLLLMVAALLQAEPADERSSPADPATAALAKVLLPAALAGRVMTHELREPTFQGWPPSAIEFQAPAEQTANGLCRREVFHLSLMPAAAAEGGGLHVGAPVRGVELAAGGDCTAAAVSFAHVQPASAEQEAVRAFGWLASARAAAAEGQARAQVACASEIAAVTCGGDALSTFGALRLEHTYLIERLSPAGVASERWSFAVRRRPLAPGQPPGQPFWDVTLTRPASGEARIDLRYRGPAPF